MRPRRPLPSLRQLLVASLLLAAATAISCAGGGEVEESPPAPGTGGGSAGDQGDSSAGSGGSNAGGSAGGGTAGTTAGTAGAAASAGSAGEGGVAGAAAVGGDAGGAAVSGAGGQSEDGGGDDATDSGADVDCTTLPEDCNGLDDNCNGTIDEGDPGGGGDCAVVGEQGVCAEGVEHCVSGFLQCQSQATPSPETCNGLDDNCNGAVDENNPGGNEACNTGNPGVCADGVTQCNAGNVECEQTLQASSEVCNGLDDDCNGIPDDGFPGVGQPCTVPNTTPGTPCAEGLTNCLGGQNGCTPKYPTLPDPETCNGVDEDCNGQIDDGLNGLPCSTGLQGICASGETLCQSNPDGGSSQCIPDAVPGTVVETCNALDDNCDGTVDNVINISLECSTKHPQAANVVSWLCTTGLCQVAQCAGNFADCDGAPGNGCEVFLPADPLHCGGCPNACNATHGTPTCVGGNCGIVCDPGWGNCDTNPANGCEKAVADDPLNCGACGATCTNAHGSTSCIGTSCVPVCDANWADCSNPANGCETDLTDKDTCGTCTTDCDSPLPTNASSAACSGAPPGCEITGCVANRGDCNGVYSDGCEANTQTDKDHCGNCTTDCDSPLPSQATSATCTSGQCDVTGCNANRGDCNGVYSDGCEVNHLTNKDYCGDCSTDCDAALPPQATSASCSGGQCQISGCNAGRGDCNGLYADGCEINTNTNKDYCGDCSTDCDSPLPGAGLAQATSAACDGAGACEITGCQSGRADCNGVYSDGCEVDLNTDEDHCGACSRACSTSGVQTRSCNAGLCDSSCNSGYGNCTQPAAPTADNGCETNINTSTSDCGGCGRVCSSTQVATLACSGGLCTSTCNGGYGNCTQPAFPTADNGCESNTSNDTSNCGGCGRVCSSTQVASLSCSGGVCNSTCNANYGNCTQPAFPTADNGCETTTAPTTCPGLNQLTVTTDGTKVYSGTLATGSDVDWIYVTFEATACGWSPRITLDTMGNPLVMNVYPTCSGGSGSGSISCAGGGADSPGVTTTANDINDWKVEWAQACDVTKPPIVTIATTVYIRIRSTGSGGCMSYTVTMSN